MLPIVRFEQLVDEDTIDLHTRDIAVAHHHLGQVATLERAAIQIAFLKPQRSLFSARAVVKPDMPETRPADLRGCDRDVAEINIVKSARRQVDIVELGAREINIVET